MSSDDEQRPDSPYKGPPRQRLDKRARERQRVDAPPSRDQRDARPSREQRDARSAREAPRAAAPEDATPRDRSQEEQRFYGVNACLALFQHRPEALRKVWLLPAR